MQNKFFKTIMLLMILMSFSSCTVIKDIFKAGMGVGIFIAIVVVVVIVYVISKIGGRNK